MKTEQQFEGLITGQQLEVIEKLRQLWQQLAVLSRSLIVSTAGNLGDVQAITNRLTALPDAFAEALGQYLDPGDADHFKVLLQEHIAAITALFTAEKNNDRQTVNHETILLYDIANRIAAYLTSINPYWNQEQWSELLNDYIEMLLADLLARLTGDFSKEITIFEDIQSQAMKIADYMACGIIRKLFL